MKIIIFIAMLSTSAMCAVANGNNNGLVSQSRSSKPYHYINIKGEMNVKIIQDKTPGVTVEGSKFQVDNTISMLRDDTLFVYQANIRKESKVTVTINVDNISLIEVNGKTNVECDGFINTDFLTVRTFNGARIKLDVRALHVDTKATGCSSIDVSGLVGSIIESRDGCSVIDSHLLDAWEFNYNLIDSCNRC